MVSYETVDSGITDEVFIDEIPWCIRKQDHSNFDAHRWLVKLFLCSDMSVRILMIDRLSFVD